MQDPEPKEIVELLSRVADVKARLRQLETCRTIALGGGPAAEDPLDEGALQRARHHLELALSALGSPKWGFASSSASSLQLTGFYSSDIYKALQDVRSRKRGSEEDDGAPTEAGEPAEKAPTGNRRGRPGAGRRKADRVSQRWSEGASAASKKKRKEKGRQEQPAATPQVEPTAGENAITAALGGDSGQEAQGQLQNQGATGGGDGSKVWVQHRVDEIHRALTAAFGDDDAQPTPQPAPRTQNPPEFIGNTDTLSIPELIGFFQLQGKTGVLTIDARQEQFTLEYLRGELIHAGSSQSPDGHRLGEVLVKLGHITRERLDQLLADKSAAERIGDALRRGDVVGEEALAQALQYQIQNIFHRMFDLGGCRFTFREGLEGEPSARVRYNVTRLLLETARHRDELEERQAG